MAMLKKKQLIIGLDMGHTLSGDGTGAVGCGLKEQNLTRELGKKVKALIEKAGHKVIDCTVDKASSNSAQLQERVKKANTYNLDLFVSIHFNACVNDAKGDGKTTGVEVLVYNSSSKVKPQAQAICDKIGALGFRNRGVKTSGVYVLKNTKAPALLVETCFIDDKDDVTLYNKTVDKVAKAIAEGTIGETISDTPTNTPSGLYAVCVGAYSYETAKKMQQELINKGYKDTYLIPR